MQKNVNRTTITYQPNHKGPRTQELTYLVDGKGKHVWLIVRRLSMRACWWDAPLALWDLAVAIRITTSKFSYSLIEAQLLPCNTSLRWQIPCTGNPCCSYILFLMYLQKCALSRTWGKFWGIYRLQLLSRVLKHISQLPYWLSLVHFGTFVF